MESTVTFKAFDKDGGIKDSRTTRHAQGFRLDQYATNQYPYDSVSISYTDNNDVKATVRNVEGNTIAEYLQVKDAAEVE